MSETRGISCNELGNAYLHEQQGSRQKPVGTHDQQGARTDEAQQMYESLLGILFLYIVQNSF
jgi:hypothetical protein